MQFGDMSYDFKPLQPVETGAYEIRVHDNTGVFRASYGAKFKNTVMHPKAF